MLERRGERPRRCGVTSACGRLRGEARILVFSNVPCPASDDSRYVRRILGQTRTRIENGKRMRARTLTHLLSSLKRPAIAKAPPANPNSHANRNILAAIGCEPLSAPNTIGPHIENKMKWSISAARAAQPQMGGDELNSVGLEDKIGTP